MLRGPSGWSSHTSADAAGFEFAREDGSDRGPRESFGVLAIGNQQRLDRDDVAVSNSAADEYSAVARYLDGAPERDFGAVRDE